MKPQDEVQAPRKKRVFVVGCSRGGTTVIQSILAQHPDITSFPETQMPWLLVDDMNRRRFGGLLSLRQRVLYLALWGMNRCGYTLRRRDMISHPLLPKPQGLEVPASWRRPTRSLAALFARFAAVLDACTPTGMWVEKSPQNIFVIDVIRRFMPDALFVHVVRNGVDTVASMRDAGLKYKDFVSRFGGSHGVQRAVVYWNRTLQISASYQAAEQHAVVRLEDVIEDPLSGMQPIASLLDITLTGDMFRYSVSHIARAEEVWKVAPSTRIEPRRSRVSVSLTPEEQRWARRHLQDVDAYVPRIGIRRSNA
jgi:hypothetical protein